MGIHKWSWSSEYMECAHAPITDEEQNNRNWLAAGSASHQALKEIVLDKFFLKSLNQVIHIFLLARRLKEN